ncbi:MAG TPA: VWA domain-containing protein [Pyrinomonadaceae bacterium]|nr:VWA domain-containing protein [Pyrinomonadaceae bacterium]
MKNPSSLVPILILALLTTVTGQKPEPSPQQNPPGEDDVVRVTTSLVQIDVTVTDRDGRQVTDLRPEDFEVFEDGRQQTLSNFSYIGLEGTSLASQPSEIAPKSRDKNALPVPPVRLRPEQVRRAFALVVDDFGMDPASMHFARKALRKFVDEQMETGDLVAILRTSSGVGALQQFTTNKRQLHAAIDRIQWSPRYGSSLTGFSLGDETESVSIDGSRSQNDGSLAPDGLSEIEDLRDGLFKVGALAALEYITRGLKELPGRKAVILMTGGLPIGDASRTNDRTLTALDRLIELANRSSIVYYTIDARGLETLNFTAADAGGWPHNSGRLLSSLRASSFNSQGGMRYLAEQTGGTSFYNNNNLSAGIKRAIEDLKGYYLLAYRPDASTFDSRTGKRRFHKLTVKVKRSDLKVRTRAGFIGVADEQLLTAPRVGTTRREQLINAVNSPFSSGDIEVRLTSLFANNASRGSYIRSLLRIDAAALQFKEMPDGWHEAVVDVMAVTFDGDGRVVDQASGTETVRARGQTYDRLLRDGLIYVLNVPLKRAGGYQLRLAVRDATTERTGSANQFIEVPDFKKKRLALSGIALMGRNQTSNSLDFSQLQKDANAEGVVNETNVLVSPAVRRLRQGMEMDFGYFIYNAQTEKQTGHTQLQTQVRLFRSGQLIFTGALTSYDPSGQVDLQRLSAGGRLFLGSELVPGEYVLQIIATDELATEKYRTASQWIDFEIVK